MTFHLILMASSGWSLWLWSSSWPPESWLILSMSVWGWEFLFLALLVLSSLARQDAHLDSVCFCVGNLPLPEKKKEKTSLLFLSLTCCLFDYFLVATLFDKVPESALAVEAFYNFRTDNEHHAALKRSTSTTWYAILAKTGISAAMKLRQSAVQVCW